MKIKNKTRGLSKGRILANKKLSDDLYLIELEEKNQVKAGQFYIQRGWEE